MSQSSNMEDLRGIAGIRKRPAMYIGDIGQTGLHHLIFELFDNSVDQYFAGNVTWVKIEIDGSCIRVSDDGKGLPFDQPADTGGSSLATHYLTCIHDRATADGHAPHLHFRGHGVGLVAVNALSASLTCRSWRSGQLWEQSFVQGHPTDAPGIVKSGSGSGTCIEFVADPLVFRDATIDTVKLRAFFFEAAHLTPGLKVRFQAECFQSQNGIADLVRFHSTLRRFTGDVFSIHQECEDFEVYAAAAGSVSKAADTDWMTWCNGSRTLEHASHKTAFAKALGTLGWRPGIAMIHVLMRNPQYGTPTKSRLTNLDLVTPLAAVVRTELRSWCETAGIGNFA
ncbi:MAG: hypothetical protein KDA85_17875 [Planctomycetaceae bacterium]|nr:hypothetical protein [Planctomycetaceae bacterium]